MNGVVACASSKRHPEDSGCCAVAKDVRGQRLLSEGDDEQQCVAAAAAAAGGGRGPEGHGPGRGAPGGQGGRHQDFHERHPLWRSPEDGGRGAVAKDGSGSSDSSSWRRRRA